MLGLVDGTLHRAGDVVGVEHDLGIDVPGGAGRIVWIKEVSLRKEALFVGVENADHRHFGQVEALTEKIDTDQGVECALAKLTENRHALESIQLRVQPLAAHALFLEVAREILGEPLGQRGDQDPLTSRRPASSLPLEQGRNLTPRGWLDPGRSGRSDR